MGIFAFLTALFKHLTGVGKVIEKSLPDSEERKERLEIDKPLMEVEVNVAIANKIFNRVKNNPEANILDEIRALTNLDGGEEWVMYNSISQRVENHRKKHPILSGWRRFEKTLKK